MLLAILWRHDAATAVADRVDGGMCNESSAYCIIVHAAAPRLRFAVHGGGARVTSPWMEQLRFLTTVDRPLWKHRGINGSNSASQCCQACLHRVALRL